MDKLNSLVSIDSLNVYKTVVWLFIIDLNTETARICHFGVKNNFIGVSIIS